MSSGPVHDVEAGLSRLGLAYGAGVLLLTFGALAFSAYHLTGAIAEEERLSNLLAHVVGSSVNRVSFSGRHHTTYLAEEWIEEDTDLLYLRIEKQGAEFVAVGDLPPPDARYESIEPLSGNLPLREVRWGDRVALEVHHPFEVGVSGREEGTIHIGIDAAASSRARRANLLRVAAFAFGLSTLGLGLVLLIGRRYTRPVQKLADEFAGILEHAPVAICIQDSSGAIVRVGAGFEALFGDGSGVLGRSVEELVGGPWAEQLSRQTSELLRGIGEPKRQIELELGPPRRRLLLNRFAIAGRVSEQRLVGTVALDVTEQRDLEKAMSRGRRMESIGQFAGGVAHDFNNILTGIAGTAEELASGTGDARRMREHATQLRTLTQMGAELTSRLLSFGRRQVTVSEPSDLNAIVLDLERLLTRIVQEDVQIELRVGPPDVLPVRVDRGQIDQVLLNLVGNARDAVRSQQDQERDRLPPEARSKGRIVVSTGRVELAGRRSVGTVLLPAGEYALLQVDDNGTGIASEIRDRLFDPFETTKGLGKGTGLGLSIVHGIVGAHGGGIEFETAEGEGTTFSVYLPLIDEALLERTQPHRVPAPRLAEKAHILVVEDNEFVRTSIVAGLRRLGHDVAEAPDGVAGVELFTAGPDRFDAVLVDVIMPGLDGAGVCEAISALRPGVRILFMTGYDDEMLQDLLEGFPNRGYIQKPFTVDALVEKLGSLGG